MICQLGDMVTVRDWKDMLDEYGYNRTAKVLDTPEISFTPEMRPSCNNLYQIQAAFVNRDGEYRYRLRSNTNNYGVSDFHFSAEMFQETTLSRKNKEMAQVFNASCYSIEEIPD